MEVKDIIIQDGFIWLGKTKVPYPEPIGKREPLAEPACRVVDAIKEMLLAACNGEYVDAQFVDACRKYGLLQYESDDPSDVGIINFLQPVLDAAFHSRNHRQKEIEARHELAYRLEEVKSKDAGKQQEKEERFYSRIEERYVPLQTKG